MPNLYGYPVDRHNLHPDDFYGKMHEPRLEDVERTGVSSPISLCCGFWYEWSLALGTDTFGFDIANRKAVFFDDGRRVITVSTWKRCGQALASLLSLPESGGATPSVADYKNRSLDIYSFRVCQRDILDSLNRVLNTTDGDWDISYEPLAERVKESTERMQNGDRSAFAKFLYGGVFFSSNERFDFAATGKTANQALGLSEESLDEATKRTVDMVEGGWSWSR